MVDRRGFLKGGAAGLAGILASRRPQGEAELKRQLAEYGKQLKMEVVLETINENDLQTRITATIRSGSGPDIVPMLHGKFYSQSEFAARDGRRWLALPHRITPALVNDHKAWFAEVGAAEPPRTLDP